jgi:hypothetical protein
MTDDAASDEAAPEPPDEAAPEPQEDAGRPTATPRSWLDQNRTLALALGCVGLCGVIALDVHFMLKSDAKRGALATATALGSATAPRSSEPFAPPAVSATSATPNADAGEDSSEALDYESDDGEPRSAKPAPPKHFATVQQAATDSCTTASVDGLSRQIIAQARCIKPNAFVPLPSRPNLVVAPQVFPYLELAARDHLLKAVEARPKLKMTINSALRTVAQQYLVWRWSMSKRCGVPLATPPGESNHEIGVALDVAEAATWRPVLEAQQFKWLGASDRVHFDFKGSSAPPGSSTDVLAFQRLWNRNHPTDKISEDGRYSPAVEQRLKQAPPDGFVLGPTCVKAGAAKPN